MSDNTRARAAHLRQASTTLPPFVVDTLRATVAHRFDQNGNWIPAPMTEQADVLREIDSITKTARAMHPELYA